MADKTTGELDSVKVEELPAAPDIYDDFKMPGELQGEAVHVTGAQLKRYAQDAVSDYVDDAEASAASANSDAEAAKKSAADASNAKTSAQSALAGVQNAIKNIPAGSTPIVNDLTTGGATMALSAEMGKTLGQRPNPQLLDNGYFLINQRGKETYTTAGTGVDRWWAADNATVTPVSNGVTLTNRSGSLVVVQQYLDDTLTIEKNAGMKVTLSVLADGKLWYATGTIPESAPSTTTTSYANVATDFGFLRLNISTSGSIRFVFVLNANVTTVIQAAKLELGSVQTLAYQNSSGVWVLSEAPNYAEELARCQRYQLRVRRTGSNYLIYLGAGVSNSTGTTVRVSIPTPVTMRKNPEIVYLGDTTISGFSLKKDGVTITPTAVTRLQYEGFVMLAFTVSGAVANSVYAVDFHPDGFLLDAN